MSKTIEEKPLVDKDVYLGYAGQPTYENTKESKIEEKDPNGVDQHQPGAKLDAGKLRPYLVMNGFKHALHHVWSNGTFGANKYTDNGWKEVPNAQDRYLGAAFRHFEKWMLKQDKDNIDPESKTHHLCAMAWNILAVAELELTPKK